MHFVDILVIGAGPAGSVCSSLLNKEGIDVLVVEKQQFPRFSIGESLLPQSMVFLEKAGMLNDVLEGGYQYKNGAAFRKQIQYSTFDFSEKSSNGPASTFQVKRADFDKRLADCAQQQGVEIRFQHEVIAIKKFVDYSLVTLCDESGMEYQVKTKFILDASGFGRVLPRLFELEKPSNFPMRRSLFCHIKDNIIDQNYDREKILVCVHPDNQDVWFWLIPFADGHCSLGIVAEPAFFAKADGTPQELLMHFLSQEPSLAKLLDKAEVVTEVQQINGYSADVDSLYGANYALLGNAGEFLDPVFSSGVTIAFKSADLAANLIIRERRGEATCWQKDYAEPLKRGVDTFRVLVEAWYDGRLQDIIFYQDASDDVRQMICSILAGYAWDDANPYVSKTERRLNVLAEICKS